MDQERFESTRVDLDESEENVFKHVYPSTSFLFVLILGLKLEFNWPEI